MQYIYDALDFLSQVGVDIKNFFTLILSYFNYFFTLLWLYAMKFYFTMKLWGLELAYDVAKMLLKDYEVYTILNNAFNKLSPDYRAICHALGIVEAIRIIIDAFATALVLRVMGW